MTNILLALQGLNYFFKMKEENEKAMVTIPLHTYERMREEIARKQILDDNNLRNINKTLNIEIECLNKKISNQDILKEQLFKKVCELKDKDKSLQYLIRIESLIIILLILYVIYTLI